ncbi:MAG: lactate utilization protein C [Thermonemataceae bacterium]
MTDREKILRRVRKTLADHPSPTASPPNFNVDVYTSPTEEDLAILFAENLLAVQGNFCFCVDEQDFLSNLVALLKQKDTTHIFVWDKHLQDILRLTHIPFQTTAQDFLQAEVGITTCEALVARTGSILVSSQQAGGRRLSIYPPVHIVVAFTSQLVYDVKAALQQAQQKDALPSMLSFITGPSRTADIEKTLVLGAHGPKELHVFLIDDLTS